MNKISVLSFLLAVPLAAALDNGFGRTPVMGYNTYNAAACTINQTFVRDTINSFDSAGFRALGYTLFGLDCGWQGQQRQSNGSIDYDHSGFPDGIKPLSSLAISKGFTWGMYTDEGEWACDTAGPIRPGSLGYERQDALQLAGWNTKYLKVDNCWIDGNSAAQNAPKDPRSDFPSRFQAMQNALSSVGIPGMLVCQWGTPYKNDSGLYGPSAWTPPLSTSFRATDDIATGWSNVMRIYNQMINIVNNGLTGPGHFADMDLLEVGNPGMTTTEQATHFAIWAMMKSPLMISTRISGMDAQAKATLQNKGLIAINQDSLGQPVKLYQRFSLDNDAFFGPLANGDVAVLLVDQSNTNRYLYVNLPDLGISSATVTNLWTGEVKQGVSKYGTNVNAHGSLALRLSNVVKSSQAAPTLRYYEAEAGSLSNGATVSTCSGCSGGKDVGYIGGSSNGILTFNGVTTSQATQDVRFDYVDCEIGYLAGGTNTRGASISVNGGAGTSVVFPLSGYDWSKDVAKSFRVRLSGFKTGGATNTIAVSGLSSVSQYAPDIDRIGVVA